MGKVDKQDLISILNTLDIESKTYGDNLAIVLASYFEEHLERPENDPIDEEYGWGEWTIKQTEDTIELMADQIMKKLKKLEK